MKARTTFTETESQFIKENYLTMPVKTIASKIGRSGSGVFGRMKQLGLVVPREIIEMRKAESRFKKGAISFNKGKKQSEFMSAAAIEKSKATRFKKGSIPHNTQYDGHERITKDGYIEIRLSIGKYRLKHLNEWEKLNGALPKGSCLRCVDGNQLNTDPSNWILITRAENMKQNTIHRYPEEIKQIIRLKSKLQKHINNDRSN